MKARARRPRRLPGRFELFTATELLEGPKGSFAGAPGYVNRALADELGRLGGERVPLALPPHNVHPETRARPRLVVPLGDAVAMLASAGGDVNLRITCDQGLSAWLPPASPRSSKLVVLLHGFLYTPGLWLTNPLIDAYWANSSYAAGVLGSLLDYPDLAARRPLHPGAARRVSTLELPLPALEFPRGYPSAAGGDLPRELGQLLDGTAVLAHALIPGKVDAPATAALAVELARSLDQGGRRFHLIIPESEQAELVRAAERLTRGRAAPDLFVPVPYLHSRAVTQFLGRSDLGLLYQRIPDSFGMYPLESILAGVPVYTNGAGNLRHLLPPDHGLVVDEEIGLSRGLAGAARRVAARILADLEAGRARAASGRGASAIRARHDRASFRASLASALAALARPPAGAPAPLGERAVDWGPLVRVTDPERGRLITDRGELILSGDQRRLAADLVGQPLARALALPARRRAMAQDLFASGALALAAADERPRGPTATTGR